MAKNMKKRITETAVILFNKNGSHSITTNHIIHELKISPGTFYYHYRNKEEIIRDIFSDIKDEFTDIINQFEENKDFENIIINLKDMFSLYYKYRFFYTEITILLDRDSELKKIYIENFNLKKEKVKMLFEAMEKTGFLIPGFTGSDDYKYISDILWIISDYRTSFIKTVNNINEQAVSDGYISYLMILKPYMTDRAKIIFDKLTI